MTKIEAARAEYKDWCEAIGIDTLEKVNETLDAGKAIELINLCEARQERQVEQFQKEERRLIPPDTDYRAISGLRLEARQKLEAVRPRSIGQASRISGVSPADVSQIMLAMPKAERTLR